MSTSERNFMFRVLQLEGINGKPGLPANEDRASISRMIDWSTCEDKDLEDAWAAEVERRIAEVESGAVQVIPIADALAQVRAALK